MSTSDTKVIYFIKVKVQIFYEELFEMKEYNYVNK